MQRIAYAFVLTAGAMLLTACSTTRLVDTDVQAFSTVETIPPGATYRFERLPSQQQTQSAQQGQLEAIAQQALERVGLKPDAANPSYTVQVGLQAQRRVEYDPWSRGFGPGWGPGFGPAFYGRRGFYGGYGYGGAFAFPDRVLYAQQIGLTLRETGSGRIVYETHAAHDSLQPANAQVLAVMLDSALYGFPKAPVGVRRVNVEIPPVSKTP